uniref:Transposase n=1 Tax=Ascaris lumbricoides TaxID=6252 RepID=A0A0M3HMI8_ASCLU
MNTFASIRRKCDQHLPNSTYRDAMCGDVAIRMLAGDDLISQEGLTALIQINHLKRNSRSATRDRNFFCKINTLTLG